MKKPSIAFILSLLIPGAGLAYAGKWRWGLVNFGIVLVIGAVAMAVLSKETFDEYVKIIALACAVGSAGFARSVADQLNGMAKRRSAVAGEG
jgi:hypothetical protein